MGFCPTFVAERRRVFPKAIGLMPPPAWLKGRGSHHIRCIFYFQVQYLIIPVQRILLRSPKAGFHFLQPICLPVV